PAEYDADSMSLDRGQVKGLIRAGAAGVAFIATLVVILLLPDSPFIEPGQSLVESTVLKNIAIFISLFFTLIGVVYGYSTRAFTTVKADRKSTRLNSSHVSISYAVFCLKKKKDKK